MKPKRIKLLFLAFTIICSPSFGQLTFWNQLELYYPFNNDALDYSGNGLNGTPVNVSPAEGVFGDANGSYYFNGNNSRVVRNALSLSDSCTFSCWIYSDLDSQAAPLIYNGHTAQAGFGIFMKKPFGNFGSGYRGKTLVVHQGGVSESYFNNSFEVPVNQWLHLALVRRGQTLQLYLNGIFQASAPYVANAAVGEFSLGASTDHVTVGYPAFKGRIDEVMVFSSALNAQNIYKVFQANLTSTKNPLARNSGFLISPNPAVNQFEIQRMDETPIEEIEILDAQGKSWYKMPLIGGEAQSNVSVRLPLRKPGIHILKVRSGGESNFSRIVLE
jgi:hypothetical protein